MTRQNNEDCQSLSQRHWQAHVTAQKKSGLSRAEYCRQHQLSYHASTYWNKKLSKSKVSCRQTTLVPVTLGPSIRRENPLVAVQSTLKIILPDKIAVEVSDNFSPVTLSRLLATLERK